MKRSRNIRLVLMGTVALTLSACDEQVPADVFETVNQCLADGRYSDSQCRDAITEAERKHLQQAPRYTALQDCETDYGTGKCQTAPPAPTDPQSSAQSNTQTNNQGGSFFMPFMAGYMMSQLLQPNRYAAQPLYRPAPGATNRPDLYTAAGNRVASGPGSTQVSRSALTAPSRPLVASRPVVNRGGFGATGRSYSSAT